eukprot:10942521-Lingulodinium_polyedra.AAC.1
MIHLTGRAKCVAVTMRSMVRSTAESVCWTVPCQTSSGSWPLILQAYQVTVSTTTLIATITAVTENHSNATGPASDTSQRAR